jgi:hypothetical protein
MIMTTPGLHTVITTCTAGAGVVSMVCQAMLTSRVTDMKRPPA